MGSIRLRISVEDIESVIASFDVIRVKKSVTSISGPYEYITAEDATPASLLAVNAGSYNLVGKILSLIIDGQDQVDVLFTGSGLLSAAQVVSQINAELGATIAAVEGSKVRLTSLTLGTESVINILVGSANIVFGWDDNTRVVGKEPHIPLQAGRTLYEIVDDDGGTGCYYYKANYYNTVNHLSSTDSSAFLGSAAAMVSSSRLSVGYIDLVDESGIAIPEQEITFYSSHEPLQIDGFQVALARKPISVVTDNTGHAEVMLVRGLKVRVVFEGTGLIREIVVPDADTFDLLQLMGTAADPYSVKTLDLPAAPRRTI